MVKILDPKVDSIFKKLFGAECNSSLLISFLNGVFNSKGTNKEIKEVSINNTEMLIAHSNDKISRLDVVATTNGCEKINIEIQIKTEYNMIKRTLYYWSKLYSSQLGSGDPYESLKKTVTINILNFNYLDNNEYHNEYLLKEKRSNEVLDDTMEVHFIELKKIDINKYKDINNVEADIKKDSLLPWALFLKEPESEVVLMLEERIKELKKAAKELEKISHDKDTIKEYEYRQKLIHDEISNLLAAQKKGLALGTAQGLAKGKAEGKAEEKVKVATNLLKQGIDIDIIVSATGLSKEEIINIKENIK